ncbi:MAG: alpha/beta hydrolase [Caenibius sp.]
MIAPRHYRWASGNPHGLPKSNQAQEDGIIQADQPLNANPPGRVIPSGAREGQWHAADGQPIRRIDISASHAPPHGSLLFLPGRGDFYEKYLETLDHWAGVGWQVTALDWRGQAGSGRLGKDDVTGHVSDFSLWLDDLGAFWREWEEATPGPHVLAGHSMGGHLVLRAAAEGLVSPDALILSAPMLGFTAKFLPAAVLHAAARAMTMLGDPARPAWKWSEKPGELPADRIALLTHDQRRYDDELWWRAQRPELVMGPGSWGWVERAYASMRGLARPGLLENVRLPVLMLGSSADGLVDFGAMEQAAAHLPDCTFVAFGPEARHEILREEDAVRNRALDAIDRFLARIAPQRAQPE